MQSGFERAGSRQAVSIDIVFFVRISRQIKKLLRAVGRGDQLEIAREGSAFNAAEAVVEGNQQVARERFTEDGGLWRLRSQQAVTGKGTGLVPKRLENRGQQIDMAHQIVPHVGVSHPGILDDQRHVHLFLVNGAAVPHQPFLAKGLGKGRTVTVNFESSYDWKGEQWTVPFNLGYSKVSKIGKQLVSYQGGIRYYFEAPEGGPEWGLRLTFTLLYPKR